MYDDRTTFCILPPPARDRPPESAIVYLNPVLAALTGIVYAGLSPIPAGGVSPNLVVAGVVVAGVFGGLPAATVWALVGGITANLVLAAPLGALPLALLLVAGLTVGEGRLLQPRPMLWIGVAAATGAPLFALVVAQLVDPGALGSVISTPDVVLWSAVATTVVAAVAGWIVRVIRRRLGIDTAEWGNG